MSDTLLLPIRGRDGRYSGDLPAEAAREIARRLRAGESYDAISTALGIRKATGRRKCAEVARTIGMPVQESGHVVFARAVAALVEQGLTDQAIADRVGRTIESVAAARVRALGRKYQVVRLTADEYAEIDRRITNRESTRDIAAAIGCDQGTVWRRSVALRDQMRTDLPPCTCGKPAGHGGRCRTVVDPNLIRQRLLDGVTAAQMARELGISAQGFKPKYVQPVIDQLTAEGHRCGCGQPFGHQFACPVTMAGQRRTFTAEQRAQAAELIRGGAPVRAVREALGITINSANMLVDQVRRSLAEEGVVCPCGQPIDHRLTCPARNGDAKGRTAFRFTSATAAKMTQERRRAISRLARAGHGCKAIRDRTGESEWRVDVLIAELRAAGHTPAKCTTCENAFNHKGPCVLPKRCACGRWRNHRGACRKPGPKKTVSNGGKPPAVERGLYRAAMDRYRAGESIQRISEATGIGWGTVQKLVAYWRRKSRYELKPCACGRPARHPGGCIVNTPGAVGKLEKARIVDAIRAGEMPHRVAEQLGVHVQTVLKHSAEVRERMFTDGITCACGQPVHHPYWCSTKWDAHEQPRGRRPFAEPNESRATEALLRGDIVADIAKAAGVGTDGVWRLRRSLNQSQREQRTRAIRDRIARAGRLGGEQIMSQIRAAVPRGIDKAVRDDVEAEIYLAVIEGRIEVEQIQSVARSYVSRGLKQWQSAYGPRSLDAPIGADDCRTRGEMIEDATALGEIDDITIGGPT